MRTFWRNDETASFGGTTVDGLDDIDQLEREGRMPSMDRYKVFRDVLYLLFVIHCPITIRDEDEGTGNLGQRCVSEEEETHILLLFPVPRSIMMCLFLQ